MPQIQESILSEFRFLAREYSELQTRTYDLTKHKERVKAQKLLVWAMANSIELRVNRVTTILS